MLFRPYEKRTLLRTQTKLKPMKLIDHGSFVKNPSGIQIHMRLRSGTEYVQLCRCSDTTDTLWSKNSTGAHAAGEDTPDQVLNTKCGLPVLNKKCGLPVLKPLRLHSKYRARAVEVIKFSNLFLHHQVQNRTTKIACLQHNLRYMFRTGFYS